MTTFDPRVPLLTARIDSLESALLQSTALVDTAYILTAGALVFMMQSGFSMLEAGWVRSKNAINILFKNLFDVCAGCAAWYFVGFAFAYGDNKDNPFIGDRYFALSNVSTIPQDGEESYANFFFQFAFLATAATIASGAMAERTHIVAYLIYTCFLSGFVYPVVVHWSWSSTGWMSPFKRNDCCLISDSGYIDFAGSGVVHVTGGFAGLVGAVVLGPRLGRFDNDGPKPQGHNIVLVALGTFILWFGWYGFNPGSTLGAIGLSAPETIGGEFGVGNLAYIAALVATNTTLSAAFAGITGLILSIIFDKEMNLGVTLNAVLVGLVTITAGCSVMDPWGAIICGILGALVGYGTSKLLIYFKVDDPIDAFPVHGAGGVLGVLLVGFFAMDYNIVISYGGGDDDDVDQGCFVGGNGNQLLVQFVAVICIVAWVLSTCLVLFLILRVAGVLRVPVEHEKKGLDESKHGGHAYPEHSLIMRTLASRVMGGGAQGSPATGKR